MRQAIKKAPRLTKLAGLMASASVAGLLAPQAFAQTATSGSDAAGLERVVITATSVVRSKMRSSVSVTDIDQDQIRDAAPRTEAEVLLQIPGIRTDATAGPAGNSNITVRGLPISSGGSKYVQLQEDGLPTVQFGDMNFSNNDYWIRFDANVDRIQTLRGGSSSVFASHAPGAVINYISKTGKQAGGSIGLSRGVNFAETRVDAEYGGRISSDMYYHFGGYYREGEGARRTTAGSLLGYQLKGNITKEFNGGKGYFRVNFKALDEHAPTTWQSFLVASKSGNTYSGFSRAPGYDGTRDTQYSIYNQSTPGIDPITRQVTNTSLVDGISVSSKSVGFEFQNQISGFTVDNRFRISRNGGAFQAQFWDVQTLGNLLGGFAAGSSARFYNGPRAGQVVTTTNLLTSDALVSKSAAINTQTPDMGNMVNDFSVSHQIKSGGNTIDLKGGWFYSRQNVVQRWAISERVVEVGRNGAVLDIYNAANTALTTAGLTGYNNQWGGCCARDIDSRFTTSAPYASLNFGTGPLDVDVGVRRETFMSNATYAGGSSQAYDVNGDGVIRGAENNVFLINPGTARSLSNYKIGYTNYSAGVNYRVTQDLSAFGRVSKGYRAISDRLLFSPNIVASTGLLADGGAEAALAPVTQQEIGTKFRTKWAGAALGGSFTVFRSTTNEFDFDQTRQDNPALPNYQGPKLNQLGFKASGFELESALGMGAFGLNFNLVYSKEEITLDKGGAAIDAANPTAPKVTQVGKSSSGVPKVRFNISPRYEFGPLTVGATVRGQGEVWANGGNTEKIGGYWVVSSFANYAFGNGLVASVQVNNLFDKVHPTGGGGFVGGSSRIMGVGTETARTINASVKYNF